MRIERNQIDAVKAADAKTQGFAFLLIGISALLAVAAWLANRRWHEKPAASQAAVSTSDLLSVTLPRLLSMTPGELGQVDIALLNLRCATGLGCDSANWRMEVAELDRMARQVRMETERHYRKFQTKPEEFSASEAYFRMLCLVTVLQQDFGVRYSSNRARQSDGPIEPNETFFADSRDIFLHGLFGSGRAGTCASLPVLYVAVGRRLNYPLKLVATKNHLFVRWEDSLEHLNIEATSEGLTTYDDDYYRRWPFPMSPEEERAERYLVSLTAAEELAVFLSLRTQCLVARECQEQASRFAPDSSNQRRLLELVKAHCPLISLSYE